MRTLPSAVQTRLEAGALIPRDFAWFIPRDRTTGVAAPVGFWSDLGTVSATVIGPRDGLEYTRSYKGAGNMVQVSEVPMVAGLTAQPITITLNSASAEIDSLFREYDLRFAEVQLHRGFIDPATMVLASPATPRFLGFVDDVAVETPEEGGVGSVTLTCISQTQELSRNNPAKRSDQNQRLRNATDDFFLDVATVGDWKLFWGQKGE